MHIGILETGRPPEELADRHGSYPGMFEAMLKAVEPGATFTAFAAIDGEVPTDPTSADAWLITGSRYGVYDRLAWMAPLNDFIRAAYAQQVPLVGICFGHQAIADALGGEVVKSDKGWGLGVHDYDLTGVPVWMQDAPKTVSFHAVHQDQVVGVPKDATVFGASDFCPSAFIAYGDRAFTLQPHPEFDDAFMDKLLDIRLRGVAPDDAVVAAQESLGRPVHQSEAARWIIDFIRHALKKRAETSVNTAA